MILSPNTIPLHFDVAQHSISLTTFVNTAEHTKSLIHALNQEVFGGSLQFEILVVPPEAGTFLSKFEFYLLAGSTALFSFLNTPMGEGYVKGLTDHTPQEWMQKLGESHQNMLNKTLGETEENVKLIGETVVAEMAKGALAKDNDEYARLAPLAGQLSETIEARCQFFEACIYDKKIKGVEFSNDGSFQIRRKDFPKLAIRPPVAEKEEEHEEWFVSIERIYVTSPNWEREGRKWKGKDGARRDCLFEIEDDLFWHHVKYRELRVDIMDQLKVQWIFKQQDGKVINRRVVRVIEYNEKYLNEPMDVKELQGFLDARVNDASQVKFSGFL